MNRGSPSHASNPTRAIVVAFPHDVPGRAILAGGGTCAGEALLAGESPITIERPPALRATGIALRIKTAVSLPSIARSMRNHVDAGKRRSAFAGTSIRSRTTSVQTPDCTTRLSDLMARSITRSMNVPGPFTARTPGSHAGSIATAVLETACPRTHNSRDNSNAARVRRGRIETVECIDQGHGFAACVAAPSAAQARLVRPDDAGPDTSDTWPRGNPPAALSCGLPARECTIQDVSPESRNRVVAQPFGQRRGESSVEFSFSEKSFDGGSGGHIHLYFAKLSPL